MAKKKREFTIDRGAGRGFERTIVGKDGKKHGPYPARKNVRGEEMKGKDDHFTDNGKYQRAIKGAIRENKA